jgi:hypothetical protein
MGDASNLKLSLTPQEDYFSYQIELDALTTKETMFLWILSRKANLLK